MIPLLCPLDGLPLNTSDGVARCSANHAFDWAKEGYLNLLPVHAKQSKDPGDSPEMIQARRRFLAAGHYNGIIAELAKIIRTHNTNSQLNILDAGCGEGHYLDQMRQQMDARLFGIDISKHAIRTAAKTYSGITWLVASNRQLPFPTQSFDILLCAFGFPVWHEFRRVLKNDGLIIMIDPAPAHLLELRQRLYPDVRLKESVLHAPEQLIPVAQHNLSYTINLAEEQMIRDLIAMTPHQHRVPQSMIDQAVKNPLAQLTIAVTLSVFKPEENHA